MPRTTAGQDIGTEFWTSGARTCVMADTLLIGVNISVGELICKLDFLKPHGAYWWPKTRADQSIVRRKISLACGIHCCPKFLLFLCQTTVSILWTICVRIHSSDCVRTVYELPLLPNNTAVKHCNTNWKLCKVLTGYLSLGCRPGGDWANMWHCTKCFTMFFSNRKQ